MKPAKEAFRELSNGERLEFIQSLDTWLDRALILDLLLSVEIETLSSALLGELARACNNTDDYEMAMAVLDTVKEAERDSLWYYRYAYAHTELAEKVGYDFEGEVKKAFEKLEKAVALATDEEVVSWCIEHVFLSELAHLVKEGEKSYPLLAKKCLEYQARIAEEVEEVSSSTPEKKLKYVKYSVEDIKTCEASFDMVDPMWATINIYEDYNTYLKSADGFTLEQRYLLAMTWYFAEVSNGGHHQFFYNSTGIVWEDTINGFKHFGMLEYAANFQKVIDYCGGMISFDRQERYKMLETLEEKHGEEFFSFLDEADNFIYLYEGQDNELNYIKANPEKFVFEGEYWGY